jgi:hypothetical protein
VAAHGACPLNRRLAEALKPIGIFARRQGRRARYRGVQRNLFDLRRACAVQNAETIQQKAAWEIAIKPVGVLGNSQPQERADLLLGIDGQREVRRVLGRIEIRDAVPVDVHPDLHHANELHEI